MKKIIMAAGLLLSLSSAIAQTTTTQTTTTTSRTKYYYYPSTNVYYNPTTSEYWYYDTPSTTWTEVKSLPATVTVSDNDRNTIYYSGTDPYINNTVDLKKYKVKKNGKVKAKDM